ncbi:helix-turn-helix domain-containing protein [Arachidicoccus terrestris]|uniref:helix-turn-helix domain-containing protein n=1 Tax=Arachidicoccus terrestris TaxID=2875539 RepID=UPI001CC5CD84|nr:helix-turn-helix domain-containing protein [Arachidicoccus terrestris]UAY55760.1 helix-turn-helix domain-containing protein [Arachidicoccus terrestris]
MKPVSEIDRYVIQKVRERRKALKLTQEDIGAALGVSSSFIAQIESDNTDARYNLKHLNELALVLKCTLYDLLPEKPFR